MAAETGSTRSAYLSFYFVLGIEAPQERHHVGAIGCFTNIKQVGRSLPPLRIKQFIQALHRRVMQEEGRSIQVNQQGERVPSFRSVMACIDHNHFVIERAGRILNRAERLCPLGEDNRFIAGPQRFEINEERRNHCVLIYVVTGGAVGPEELLPPSCDLGVHFGAPWRRHAIKVSVQIQELLVIDSQSDKTFRLPHLARFRRFHKWIIRDTRLFQNGFVIVCELLPCCSPVAPPIVAMNCLPSGVTSVV